MDFFIVVSEIMQLDALLMSTTFQESCIIPCHFSSGPKSPLPGLLGRLLKLNLPSEGQYTMGELR